MKRTGLILPFLMIIMNLNAQVLPVDKAAESAVSLLEQKKQAFSAFKAQAYELQDIETKTMSDDTPLYYICRFQPAGFVILSAQKNTYPLIGYSFDSDIPDNFQNTSFGDRMQIYERQIEAALQSDIPADRRIREAWEALHHPESYRPQLQPVAPLLTTDWDQGMYYNTMCPQDPNGPGGHVVVGCVATAMGQLMNYFRHPAQGEGAYGYEDANYGWQEVDFSQQEYNYDAMATELHTHNPEVAKLLYHIGVSVDMHYGPDGSGMYNHKAAYSMRNYFRYDESSAYMFRDSLEPEFDWNAMLIDHISQKIPLYYAGWADEVFQSGHAFVFDGYQDSTHFHVNWGWGGAYDGFFYVESLTPGGASFTLLHEAVANAVPEGSYPLYCNGMKELTAMSGSIEDGSGPMHDYENDLDCTWRISPQDSVASIELEFLKMAMDPNDQLIIYEGIDETAPIAGAFSGYDLPQALSVDGSHVYLQFISDADSVADGWLLAYNAVQPEYCSTINTVSDSASVISDGSNDYMYQNSTYCNWFIQPDGAERIHFEFMVMDIEEGDFLRMTDNSTGDIIGDFTGSAIPEGFTVFSDDVTLTFDTDNVGRADGFTIAYAMNLSHSTEHKTLDAGMYPNPAHSMACLAFNAPDGEAYVLNVYSTDGRCLIKKNGYANQGNTRVKLDVSGLSSGVYLVDMKAGARYFREMLLKD